MRWRIERDYQDRDRAPNVDRRDRPNPATMPTLRPQLHTKPASEFMTQ
jgi:hypothetical protein